MAASRLETKTVNENPIVDLSIFAFFIGQSSGICQAVLLKRAIRQGLQLAKAMY